MSLRATPYIIGSEARVEISISDLKQYIIERLRGTGVEGYITSIDVKEGRIVIEIDMRFFGLDYEVRGDKIVFRIRLPEPVR